MTLRKSILSAALIAAIASSVAIGVRAEEPGDAPKQPGKAGKAEKANRGQAVNPLIKALEAVNLTDAQKAEITKLVDQYKIDMKAARENTDKEQAKAKAREITKAFREAVLAKLTPEQKTQLEAEMKKNRPAKEKKDKPNDTAGPAAPGA